MTPELRAIVGAGLLVLLPGQVRAEDAPQSPEDGAPAAGESAGDGENSDDHVVDDPIAPFRTPFPELTERVIGKASRPVEYDWRRSRAQVGVAGHQLAELNNFDSQRLGAVGRFPTSGLLLEVGLGYVFVRDTPSSEDLALTPFRQPGRPSRVELDVLVSFPVAEGVVTTAPRWMPALQLVFLASVGLRYSAYPGGMESMTLGERARAVLAPGLTEQETANLDGRRPDAMQIDPARYSPMVAIGNDIYLPQGVFFAPRATLAVPLLAGAVESELRWWGDIALSAGLAF